MNILKFLLILQLHQAWTLNLSLEGWRLHVYKPNKSIDGAIKEYFSTKTRLLGVALHLQYLQHWHILINDFLTDVLKKSESMSFKIHVKTAHSKQNTKVFKHNLWYVDSYEGFRSLLPDFEYYGVNEIGQYMIVMQTAKRLRSNKELQQIFRHAFQLNMVDIVVAVYTHMSAFVLYSYDIFEPGKCRHPEPRQINVFRNGSFDSPELFPYKFGNFHKCPITLFVRYADPYFTFNLTEDGQHIAHYMGMEAQLVKTMVKHLNFDLRFYYKAFNFYATVYRNGTSTGPYQLLNQGYVDILLGYTHYLATSQYFTGTEAYFITPLVLIHLRHEKSFVINKWLWEPFQKQVWLLILIIIGFGIIFVSYLHYSCRSNIDFPIPATWLDMLGLTLGNARPFKFYRSTTKYACIMWAFGFMIFCAIYQGKLYDALNRKAIPDEASLQQLFDANYTFLFREVIDKDIITSLNVPQHAIQYFPYADDFDIYDEMRQHPGNVATVTNYWQFQAYIGKHQLYTEFNSVPQIVVMNQICAYMRKRSYLNEPLSRLLSDLNSAGIIKKWMRDEAVFDSLNALKKVKQDKSSTEPKPLALAKIRLVLMGLFLMHFVSMVVFLGEIIANKLSIKGKGVKK